MDALAGPYQRRFLSMMPSHHPVPELAQPRTSPSAEPPKTTSGPRAGESLNPMDAYALAEARLDTRAMAKAFLQTCPDDWCRGYNINTKGVLNQFIQGIKQSETTSPDVNPVAMMRFRWRAAQDADNLVAYFQLPVPDGQCCLMWDIYYSLEERKSRIPDYSDKYSSAFHFILDGPMAPFPIENLEGFHFPRVAQYLATAVVMADLPSSEEQDELLNRMLDFMLEKHKIRAQQLTVQIAGRKRDITEAQGTDLLL